MLRRGSKSRGWVSALGGLGIVLGVFLASQTFAQAPGWNCRIHTPPDPRRFAKEDLEKLMWIDITNREKESVPVYLHGEIKKDGKLVARANSNKIDIPPGGKRITRKDITKLTDEWWDKDLEKQLIRAPMLPEGRYEACVYVYKWNSRELLTKCCISIISKPRISPPRLLFPKDGVTLPEKERYPFFRWTPPTPTPPKVTYELKIVEVKPGQTKEEALRLNPPLFEKSGITATQFRYSAQARRLDPDKKYAWQVEASFDKETAPVASEASSVSISKFKPEFMLAHLKVTREVVRQGNWYQVILNITNKGSKDITNIVVADSNIGFQCTDDSPIGATVSSYSPPRQIQIRNAENGGWSLMEISPEWTLKPEQKMVVTYPIVPIIYDWVLSHRHHIVGKGLRVSYQVGGEQHSAKFPGLAEDLEPDVGNAFRSANFLIVTRPPVLSIYNPGEDVGKLLTAMAKLAKVRSGVLGYFLNAFAEPVLYRNYIVNDMGSKLKPGWTQFGYLLLVGEKEIIPHGNAITITINQQGDQRTIIMSDFIYADISGDLRPELKVGRIIGNTASNLIIPIEQSLAVLQHQGAENDGSDALFISGVPKPKDGDRFRLDVNSGSQYLYQYKQVWPRLIHMEDFSKILVQLFLKTNLPESDYVFYCGHGGTGGWSYFGTGDVINANITSKETRPIVLAFACHTGNYTGGFAREFLRCGAGAYVGGTVMLNVDDSRRHIRNYGLLQYYSKGRKIGDILKDWKKNSLSSSASPLDRRLLYAMNLYGDPKFGGD